MRRNKFLFKMSKQEIKESFDNIMKEALGDLKAQAKDVNDGFRILLKEQAKSNQELLKQQTDVFKSLLGEFSGNLNTLIDARYDSMKNEQMAMAKEIDFWKNKCTSLEKRVGMLESGFGSTRSDIEKVKEEVDEIESYSRRSCLIFSNIKSQSDMSNEELVVNTFKEKLGLTNANSDWIDNCHRLGKPDEALNFTDNPQRMIIKFSAGKYREAVWRSKGNLKKTNIRITEQLTKRRGQILKKCIEEINCDKWVFTNNCNVLVRFGEDNPVPVKTINDLEQLKRRYC